MSRVVDIVIFVEHVARELDVACAVKALAARRGLQVHVASLPYQADETVAAYRPHVVALPYARFFDTPGPLHHIRRCWPEARIVDLAWEQFMSPVNFAYRAPRDPFVRDEVVHHAWSDLYAEYLRSHGVAPAHIVVNGNPMYALYQPAYRRFYPGRADLAAWHELDADRPWAFFPENYAWAFLTDADLELRIRNGYDPEKAHANREFNRASLTAVINWFHEVSYKHNARIILRPRPAVPIELWRDRIVEQLGSLPHGLTIIKDGTVREWVLASDWCLSSISTTLLEAALAGKPSHVLMPLPYPDWGGADWQGLFPQLTSAADLLALLGHAPDPAAGAAAADWGRQHALAHGDPIIGLVNLLADQRAATPSPTTYDSCSLERLGERFKSLGDALRSRNESKPLHTFEHDRFTAANVARRCEIWEDLLPR